ncbi:MAG: hypothetical protein KZQ92_19360 [Candidatus Thiodiazotropha sp. (ex Lucinoma borealis)]|nr:hypothetical protein [Candidatus Thiodiazotropha sp. (ex Lucinoma borealis)]MCU7866126.1 hypothetical protein [Candidatus Thiodiazotropha sp. (ex Lucinoma borealis)]
MMHLMIVESPNKCKKNQSYLGQGWIVKASMGHVQDLPPMGYSVSPVLSHGCGNGSWLTAGRVQLVASRIVVDRELVIRQFKPIDYVEGWLLLETDCVIWQAKWELGDMIPESQKHWTDPDCAECIARLQDVKVVSVEKAQRFRHPPPPFITSTLQQAASVVFKMSPKRCM